MFIVHEMKFHSFNFGMKKMDEKPFEWRIQCNLILPTLFLIINVAPVVVALA